MAKTVLERFEEKYIPEPNSGCWLWTAAISPGPPPGKWAYGIFAFKGKIQMAHRVAYALFCEEPPRDLQLDHLCRVTLCVNPAHLEPVTAKENIRRGHNAKREQTHCQNGHELAGDNLVMHHGRRACRTCKADTYRQWVARNRERRRELDRNHQRRMRAACST